MKAAGPVWAPPPLEWFSDQLRPRELPLVPPRPPDERPLVPRLPVLPLLRPPALMPLEPPRPLPLIPPEALRPDPDRGLLDAPPDAPRDPPDVLLELLAAPRLLPDAPRELLELLDPVLRELPDAERPPLAPPLDAVLAPLLRVRSSTSPVSALSAACVESSDVIPRPIVRPRPVDPEPLLVLPLAFVPPLRFEAMHTSR